MHGLYSQRPRRTPQSIVDEALADPDLTNGLRELALMRILLDRQHALLESEEARFLSMEEESSEEDLAKMRSRLLAWYQGLSSGHAKRLWTLLQYYAGLEKKASGVAYEGIRSTMLAVVEALHEHIPDEQARAQVIEALRAKLDRIVVGLEEPGAGGPA